MATMCKKSPKGMQWFAHVFSVFSVASLSIGLVGCGGGTDRQHSGDLAAQSDISGSSNLISAQAITPATFLISGKVDGMDPGKSMVLLNNNSNALTVAFNGAFEFSQKLPSGATYNVSIGTLPSGQTCDLVRPSGTIESRDVTNIRVFCAPSVPSNYSLGGTLSGLGSGKAVVLQDGQGHTQSFTANGTFTFTTPLISGNTYAVAVVTQPTGQTCGVVNGSGTITDANVSNVTVTCADNAIPTYTVGGTLSGLGAGKSLVLRTVGANNLTLNANGSFTFNPALPNGSDYAVSIVTPPAGQSCSLTNASGTLNGANVTNVGVNCSDVTSGIWTGLQTPAAEPKSLIINSSESLLVNAPFYGIEVRKNGVDITDDIVKVVPISATSWKFIFGTQVLNAAGDTITASLKNAALATPGHFVTAREANDSVQQMYQRLQACQNSGCEGRPAVPGLLAAIKGMSQRYEPRDIETSPGQYNFSDVFSDAAFLASKGMKLHVMFTVKSFATDSGKLFYNGNGSNRYFNISTKWDKDRNREVHVYLKNSTGKYVETTAFSINKSVNPARVEMNTAPPSGNKNVLVVYARDPFPNHVWNMSPPIASWYNGEGGQNNNSGATGNFGHVYAPWRANCVTWLSGFMKEFRKAWTNAINAGTLPANAIESISIQETANPLGDTSSPSYDRNYTPEGYRAGLFELAKATARAVRGRGLFGQLFNGIAQGNQGKHSEGLATDVSLWGGRIEGPDLFNDEPALENYIYPNVHRAFNDKGLSMIWHQNASYSENIGTTKNYYTPAQQFIKAQRGVTSTNTPSGTLGLQAEYVFWNMSLQPTTKSDQYWVHALPVIAANPVIQTTGNDRYRWRRSNGVPIPDQTVTRKN